jgi:hypothetical protein
MVMQPKKTDHWAAVKLFAAIAVLATLVFRGDHYTRTCIARGGDFEKCWEKGLHIAGMNEGGPLGPALVIGYIIGTVNKEKEKQDKYHEGYWTLNPELRSATDPPSNDPSISQ